MFDFITSWRRQHEAFRELGRLSDRELADLGIARSDIRSVVEAAAKPAAAGRQTAGTMAPSWGKHLAGVRAA